MSSLVRYAVAFAMGLLLLLVGCVGAPKRADVVPVVEAYVKQTQQLQEQERQRLQQGIVHLTVSQNGFPENYLVSVELEDASLNTVIYQILEQTTVAYLFDSVTLRGRVTARFADLSLLQALNTLLQPRGYSASVQDELLVIGDMLNGAVEVPAATQAPGPEETAHVAVPLTYLDVESAAMILQGLYPAGANNVRLVDSAGQTETNTLYLRGPKEEVRRAALQIRRADQQPSHVVIEALVVEFDARALEQFGIDISNATHNQYSDVATAFGSLSSPALVFTRVQGAANVTAFTATIDALVGQDKARVVARPYMSTVSGKPAAINITGNIYVLSQVVEGGAAIVTPTAITSGVILNIILFVRDDEMI